MPSSDPAPSAREALIADVAHSGVTLVLGAGVSAACRVAGWRELASDLWREAFGADLPEVADDPRFYPFVFEHVQQVMGDAFAGRLKDVLYAEHALPSRADLAASTTNTLAVVARVLASEAQQPLRHVVRVITLNVDDLLERAVVQLHGARVPDPPVRPVVRASAHAGQARGCAAIPIYHLHGYLRSGQRTAEGDDADVLVFTDMQYWASAAFPSSHMNRTFSFALHDSHCLFVGMSMTDLNIWRWLALRAFEIASDCRRRVPQANEGDDPDELYRRSLDRHYWITPRDAADDGFLSECLALRGVRTVPIESWHDASFFELMRACFPHALDS